MWKTYKSAKKMHNEQLLEEEQKTKEAMEESKKSP